MSDTLKVSDLREAIKDLPGDTVVIIGDDDELNEVHNAWYAQTETLSNIKKREMPGFTMLHGDIMEDPEYPGMEFNVYLGRSNNKFNKKFVLLIS